MPNQADLSVNTVNIPEPYYRKGVKIEFGGRNMREPHERHTLTPYLAAEFPDLAFVTAAVDALAGERTFWEKVTLVHAESNRETFKATAGRLSRHWYDLAVLSTHPIGARALANVALLEDVVKVKTCFYNSGFGHYEQCLTGQANLLPEAEGRVALRADYEAMVRAGMLEEPMSFDDVEAAIAQIQVAVNAPKNPAP